jgi:hypothetical protein
MAQKQLEHIFEFGVGNANVLRRQAARDQGAGAGAEQRAGVLERRRRQAFLRQNEIQRADQVARRIGQRAIQIENIEQRCERSGQGGLPWAGKESLYHCFGLFRQYFPPPDGRWFSFVA